MKILTVMETYYLNLWYLEIHVYGFQKDNTV